jgi:DNA-binding NarL/FixJ family response regulator
LADDHPTTLDGLRAAFSRCLDIEIVGEAYNGMDAQHKVATLCPQVLLLDLGMPHLKPAEFVKWMRKNYPETVSLILTYHRNESYLAGMMEAGAVGYFRKDVLPQQLIDAIRHAASGETVFTLEQFLAAQEWKKEVGEKIKRLTPKEREIIKWITMGRSNRAISVALNISEKTIAFHLTHIYSKWLMKSRFEVGMWAADNLLDNLDIFPSLEWNRL